jgi:hypothetical protein
VTKPRKALLIALGTLAVLAVAAFIAVFVYSSVDSVSVRFVNDTGTTVSLPDCGPDITTVAATTSLVINVFQPTAYCSIDVQGPAGSEVVGGCLKMPTPLANGDVVHVSKATHNLKPCS